MRSDLGKINWTLRQFRLDELTDYYKNPRSLSEKEFKQLKTSLDKFGMIDKPIVNADSSHTIIGGHQRKHVLEATGVKEIDCWIPDRELSDKEVEELNIRLNKNTGSWDFDTLANEFELDDLLEWGFDKGELDLGLWADDAPEDVEPQIDKAQELRVKWGVESGQLWQLGEHRLICGDCTDKAVVERVMGGEKAELTLTDPPYGIDVVPDSGEIGWSTKQAKVSKFSKVINDDKLMDVSFLLDTADKVAIFGGQYFAHYLPKAGRWLVWDKDFTDAERDFVPFSECELVWSNIPGVAVKKYKCRSMGYSREGETGSREHPNQKPIIVISSIVGDFSKSGDIVYDPFLGSGTTLIACERLGRKCRAVEISPAYVALAIQRWVDVTGGVPELLSN